MKIIFNNHHENFNILIKKNKTVLGKLTASYNILNHDVTITEFELYHVNYKNKGFGKKLFKRLVSECKQKNFNYIYVTPDPVLIEGEDPSILSRDENQKILESIYEHMGFERISDISPADSTHPYYRYKIKNLGGCKLKNKLCLIFNLRKGSV